MKSKAALVIPFSLFNQISHGPANRLKDKLYAWLLRVRAQGIRLLLIPWRKTLLENWVIKTSCASIVLAARAYGLHTMMEQRFRKYIRTPVQLGRVSRLPNPFEKLRFDGNGNLTME